MKNSIYNRPAINPQDIKETYAMSAQDLVAFAAKNDADPYGELGTTYIDVSDIHVDEEAVRQTAPAKATAKPALAL